MRQLIILIFILLCITLQSKEYYQVEKDFNFIKNESLSENHLEAITETAIALNMVQTAQNYTTLLIDSIFPNTPLEERFIRRYITRFDDVTDTIYQIDLRIYSPSPVGSRFNRMIIIRPYDNVERPCILYTHGNNGNMQTWYNYYIIGATNFLRKGYAIAFYENYNNNFFNSYKSSVPTYINWVHQNIADSTQQVSSDYMLQRGHFLLYQYAYAAQVYLSHYADQYHIRKDMLFTSGHSAGSVASMELTFANPNFNFTHPVFAYCGLYNARVYPNLPEERIPIKAILSSAGGLQDDLVQGSYFGNYFDNEDQDITAIMLHGAMDSLAPVDYGPALWDTFVDTVRLMGPLTLHQRMDDAGIQNFSFINCKGSHGVFSYPTSTIDNSGVIKFLNPFNYNYDTLTDDDFYRDTSLYQLSLYQEQLNDIMGKAAQIFSKRINYDEINQASTIYTWQTKQNLIPIENYGLQDWSPIYDDCGISDADLTNFDLYGGVPTNTSSILVKNFKIFPNPAQTILFIDGLAKNQNYLISNITGKILYSSDKSTTGKTTIDIQHLPNGIYFVIIRNMNGTEAFSKKFTILK
ncbi:MAG: T9SS type A sorting domain-containing protein [Chitinophagales bacterium]|nr:T9SS type A sorting domain-containing protein [Chitinophagales bacterium]